MPSKGKFVKSSDIKAFTNHWHKALGSKETQMQERLERALDVIEAESQRLVPEDTGRTRRSWYRNVYKDSDTWVAEFGYDKENKIEYIPIIYWNTRGVNFRKEGAEQEWLAKAILNKQSQVVAILKGEA